MNMSSTKDFVLQGGGSDFSDKQKTLFDQLLQAEKKFNKDQTSTVNYNDYSSNVSNCSTHTGKHNHYKTKQFRGKESIFKRQEPSLPYRRDNTIPDYHKNPHKWTKYSLEDVQNTDMTDKSNINVALSFLKELKARRSECEENVDIEMSTNKFHGNNVATSSSVPESTSIIFKKPLPKFKERKTVIVSEDEKVSVFRGSKVILPEYIVGERPIIKTKKDKKASTEVDRSKKIKLDHLKDLEDEYD